MIPRFDFVGVTSAPLREGSDDYEGGQLTIEWFGVQFVLMLGKRR